MEMTKLEKRKRERENRREQEEREERANGKEKKIAEEIEIAREIKGRSRRGRKEDAAAQKRFEQKKTKEGDQQGEDEHAK